MIKRKNRRTTEKKRYLRPDEQQQVMEDNAKVLQSEMANADISHVGFGYPVTMSLWVLVFAFIYLVPAVVLYFLVDTSNKGQLMILIVWVFLPVIVSLIGLVWMFMPNDDKGVEV